MLKRWWNKLLDWHYARLRRIDEQVLWPSCKDMAGEDIEAARTAFAYHALRNDAWHRLGNAVAINKRIDELQ
jgi:hypothetical protein